MRKSLLLVLFLFVSSIWAQYAVPVITAEEKSYEFGNIIEGERVSHEFIVINRGEKALKITKVRASCGCTAAEPEKKILNPGDSTKIKVEFNSAGRRGLQRKYVYVYSDDPANPEIRFNFTANIIPKKFVVNGELRLPEFRLQTNRYDFGDVKEGDVVHAEIEFENTGKSDLEITRLRSSCGCTAAVASEKVIKPGGKGIIKIDLDTKGRKGKFTRTVTVYTNDPQNSTAVITLFANINS